MTRLLVALLLTPALLLPASAEAGGTQSAPPHASTTKHGKRPASLAEAHGRAGHPSTDPVALSLHLAERYWHGVPPCGTPVILTSPHQLPNSAYETVTSPEPADSVVEMWTEVQKCTITINASLWGSWLVDDESFQWFCDAMTHEVGHLFGHLDGGQRNAASITYPFLDEASPNFNSVGECRAVTLDYGSEQIRNQVITRIR
jgi:hypothetical protein